MNGGAKAVPAAQVGAGGSLGPPLGPTKARPEAAGTNGARPPVTAGGWPRTIADQPRTSQTSPGQPHSGDSGSGPSTPGPSRPGPLGRWRRSRRRFGLRQRVTVAFAAGAAVLSAALSFTTFGLVHHYLLAERESTAVHEAYAHARVLKRDLTYAGANLGEALSSLIDAQGTVALAYREGEWYSDSVSLGESSETSRPASLPAALVKLVSSGSPAS